MLFNLVQADLPYLCLPFFQLDNRQTVILVGNPQHGSPLLTAFVEPFELKLLAGYLAGRIHDTEIVTTVRFNNYLQPDTERNSCIVDEKLASATL